MSTNVTWNGTTYAIPAAGEVNWPALSAFLIALGTSAAVAEELTQAVRVATTSPVTVSNTTDCVVITNLGVAGPVTANLPVGATGRIFFVVDGKGDAATNNITVDGNGAETINGAATYVIADNSGGICIAWNGTGWTVIGRFVGGTVVTQAYLAGTPAIGTPSSLILTNATGLPIVAGTTGTLTAARGGTGITSLGAGVATFLGTPSSANLAAALTDETGTGAAVFGTSPTLVTPALGTPSSGTLTNATGLPIDGGTTGTLPASRGGTGITALGAGVATFLGTPSSANLAAALTDETGTGAAVFAISPTLVTPALGTPSAAVLTSATGLPLATGVTGTLPIGNGGTGQTTANAALNALLPSQGGNSGKVLQTDATNTSWQTAATVPAAGAVYSNGSTLTSSSVTSGGVLYGSASNVVSSSGALSASRIVLGGGAGAAPTSLGFGSADQILGMSGGGTGYEHKTLSVGTSGTDFAVANASNSITLNLPDASSSNRGAVTTGTQSFAGVKTFSTGLSVNTTSPGGNVLFGTYTPTLISTTNVAATTAFVCMYLQIGNHVMVAGKMNVDPTSSATLTEVQISLPVVSDFTNDADASGTGCLESEYNAAIIFADVSNNRARYTFNPSNNGNREHRWQFMFIIK